MALNVPFTPGATFTLAATDVSASVTITSPSSGSTRFEVQNGGFSNVFIRWGAGAQTAVVTDYPVLPGQSKVVTVPPGVTTFAGVCATGQTTTLYLTAGQGQ